MPSTADAFYTKGSIGRTMFKTALAMLAGTVAMTGYNLVDTYFVGRLPGQIPLAAIGYTFPIVMLMGCVFRGLATGVMTSSATAIGAGDRKQAVRLVTNGLILVGLVSIAIAIIGMLTSRWGLHKQGASGEALSEAVGYINIWFFGCFTASLSMTGGDLLVGVGDSKLASLGMCMGVIANAILDPVFIFGWCGLPAMGIRGAALATVICQAGSMVYVFAVLNRRHKLLKFKRYSWEIIRSCWSRVIGFAIPAALGMFMIPLGSFVVTRVTAEFGDAAVAAAQAAGKLEMLAFMFPMSFGMSLTPLVSQNFGAKLFARIKTARRVSMGFALLFLSIMAVVFYFLAPLLAQIFSRDAEIREYMILYLRIIPWGFWAIEIHRFSTFIFTGCSRPKTAAALNVIRVMAMLIPATLIAFFCFHTLHAVFAARLVSDILGGVMGFLCARHLTNRLARKSLPSPKPAYQVIK